MTDAERERAAVVAWLLSLKDESGLPALGFRPHYLQGLYGAVFATAIQRGAHLKEDRP